MKITAFRIRNYRTLENVDLGFPSSYAAICGPNDSGKTNVVRAIRAPMKEESPFPFKHIQSARQSILASPFAEHRPSLSGTGQRQQSVGG